MQFRLYFMNSEFSIFFFFFFQAEDGIRDVAVTGVQTCALPILAIALRTMGIANSIVELAFGLTLGAIAIAVALS